MPTIDRQSIPEISKVDAAIKEAVKSPANSEQHPRFFQDLLKQFRTHVENLCTKDVLLDRTSNAFGLLWNAHNQINGFCRKGLAKVRNDTTKPVETRKFIKGYLEFLKDSQKWYRSFINLLTKNYGSMPGLERITGDRHAVPRATNAESYTHSAALCYQSLISLGDLCRWRAAENLDKEPTWGHAVGYYDLAAALSPANGMAFHQRAFVEITQKDHLRAVYYLYRAVATEERFPNAIDNLALEMRSLRKKWGTNELNPRANLGEGKGQHRALIMWYLRLQSLCYTGEEIPGHAELEKTVISHFAALLSTPEQAGLVQKIAFANMAAEHTALIRLNEAKAEAAGPIITSFKHYHRLNVKTLTTLLRCLDKEMAAVSLAKGETTATKVQSLEDLITPAMRSILPALQLYHHWLLSSHQFVIADNGDDESRAAAVQLWATLAAATSSAARNFKVPQLHEVPYLLEEDVDAIAFTPVTSDATRYIWRYDDGTEKPRFNDRGVTRQSTGLEMLARIRDLQVAAVRLSVIEDTPLRFEGGRFYAGSEGPTSVLADIPNADTPLRPPKIDAPQQSIVPKTPGPTPQRHPRTPHHRVEGAAENTRTVPLPTDSRPLHAQTSRDQMDPDQLLDRQDEQASKMVDDLVGEEDTPIAAVRSISGLGSRPPQRTPSVPSSFAPTPPTSRAGARVERLQNGSLFGQGGPTFASGMHSPLLFGNGGTWSPVPNGRSKSIGTPPNGQTY